MSTKSTRSSGTQHNQRGVTQGMTLVDPKSGLPVAVVQGPDGKYRLAVDANVTASISGVEVDLDGTGPDGDNVYLVDNVTGNKFKIYADGSIDVNAELDAADGDNVAIADFTTGDKLKVNPDGTVNTIAKNTVFTKKYDKISVLTKNDDGDPLTIKTKFNGVDSQLAIITYDADGDFLDIEVSDL